MRIIQCPGEIPDKLNFGCGTTFLNGYLNLDSNINELAISKVDRWILEGVINSPQDLPNNYFSEILCEMVMEHIHPAFIPNILYCFQSFLKDNGKLKIIVPDFVHLAKELIEIEGKEEELNIEQYRDIQEINNEVLMPFLGDSTGMAHQSIWTSKIANHWLTAEGFCIREVITDGHHLQINAVKVGGNKYASPV